MGSQFVRDLLGPADVSPSYGLRSTLTPNRLRISYLSRPSFWESGRDESGENRHLCVRKPLGMLCRTGSMRQLGPVMRVGRSVIPFRSPLPNPTSKAWAGQDQGLKNLSRRQICYRAPAAIAG